MEQRDQLLFDEHADGATAPDRFAQVSEATNRLLPEPPRHRRRRRLPEELGVIVALGLLVAIVGTVKPAFVDPDNLLNLTASSAFVGVLSLGMVFVVAMREIDLSIGWMFNFSAVVTALAIRNGVNPFLAAAFGIVFGAVLGLFNGVLAVGLRLPVLIVTLGTLSMYHGLSLVANDSRAVVPPREVRDGPFFDLLTYDLPGGIPFVSVVFVALAVVLHIVLHMTRFGYRTLAIGSNPEAARLAGVPIGRTKIEVLVLMGAIAGLSGVLFVGFRGAVDPNSGVRVPPPRHRRGDRRRHAAGRRRRHDLRHDDRRADHRRDQQRCALPRDRRGLEHIRHRPRHRRRRRRRPARAAAAQAKRGAIPGGDLMTQTHPATDMHTPQPEMETT